jgi:hypothetical protein
MGNRVSPADTELKLKSLLSHFRGSSVLPTHSLHGNTAKPFVLNTSSDSSIQPGARRERKPELTG